MILNATNIIEGWRNYFKGQNVDEKIKQVAIRRAEICGACEHFKPSAFHQVANQILNIEQPQELEKLKGATCSFCRCLFPQKLLAMNESCPMPNSPKWTKEQIS